MILPPGGGEFFRGDPSPFLGRRETDELNSYPPVAMADVSALRAEGTTGVLLTGMGGPNSLDEVGPYLLDVRGGRPTPPALVEEFRQRYARVGGKSPLLEISTAQARALEARLNRDGERYRCRVGMRHWTPYIPQVLADLARESVGGIVVLALSPYHSRRSVGMYVRAVQEARAKLPIPPRISYVESWNTQPALVDAFAERVSQGLAHLSAQGFPGAPVVFTAHSLPKQLSESGDDYEAELRETMELVLDRARRPRARLAFQSVGRTDEPWLGPPLEETLESLAEAGERAVLVVPFGFISDHLETLFDLDVEAKELAGKLGLCFERASSLNSDPRLIEAMASAVLEALPA